MVAFTCRNVKASEPLLVLDFGLGAVLDQELHDVFHVAQSCLMQWGVAANVFVFNNVRLGSML